MRFLERDRTDWGPEELWGEAEEALRRPLGWAGGWGLGRTVCGPHTPANLKLEHLICLLKDAADPVGWRIIDMRFQFNAVRHKG